MKTQNPGEIKHSWIIKEAGGIMPNLKLYYRGTVIKEACTGIKIRHVNK